MINHICTYVVIPWIYLPEWMPTDTGTTIDTVRRAARVVSGVVGFALGCVACAYVAPSVYRSASELNAKVTDATTPDGVPYKDLSVSISDKAGGGIAAAVTAYGLLVHITVATAVIGGLVTDYAIEAGQSCYKGGKGACAKAADCFKKVFCCSNKGNKAAGHAEMEKPQV